MIIKTELLNGHFIINPKTGMCLCATHPISSNETIALSCGEILAMANGQKIEVKASSPEDELQALKERIQINCAPRK